MQYQFCVARQYACHWQWCLTALVKVQRVVLIPYLSITSLEEQKKIVLFVDNPISANDVINPCKVNGIYFHTRMN